MERRPPVGEESGNEKIKINSGVIKEVLLKKALERLDADNSKINTSPNNYIEIGGKYLHFQISSHEFIESLANSNFNELLKETRFNDTKDEEDASLWEKVDIELV